VNLDRKSARPKARPEYQPGAFSWGWFRTLLRATDSSAKWFPNRADRRLRRVIRYSGAEAPTAESSR